MTMMPTMMMVMPCYPSIAGRMTIMSIAVFGEAQDTETAWVFCGTHPQVDEGRSTGSVRGFDCCVWRVFRFSLGSMENEGKGKCLSGGKGHPGPHS